MIAITSNKIKEIYPTVWNKYFCFSLLFDPEEEHFSPIAADKISLLKYDTNLEKDSLFRAFETALEQEGIKDNNIGLCILPITSYHATVWGGISPSNKLKLKKSHLDQFEAFELVLPYIKTPQAEKVWNWYINSDFKSTLLDSELIRDREWGLKLKFCNLEIWGNEALVATLEAADTISHDNLKRLINAKEELESSFKKFGNVDRKRSFRLHITIGYFANRDLGKKAHDKLAVWRKAFQYVSESATITFNTISLYFFYDMASLFKIH